MYSRFHFLQVTSFAIGVILSSCNSRDEKKKEDASPGTTTKTANEAVKAQVDIFDYTKPVNKWVLPDQLKEISGIVKLDSTKMMAIEDLHAALYILDLD